MLPFTCGPRSKRFQLFLDTLDVELLVVQLKSKTDAELASFPCAYSTAENLLHRLKLGAGETVLVTGASGGVGSAAVQLANVIERFVRPSSSGSDK